MTIRYLAERERSEVVQLILEALQKEYASYQYTVYIIACIIINVFLIVCIYNVVP